MIALYFYNVSQSTCYIKSDCNPKKKYDQWQVASYYTGNHFHKVRNYCTGYCHFLCIPIEPVRLSLRYKCNNLFHDPERERETHCDQKIREKVVEHRCRDCANCCREICCAGCCKKHLYEQGNYVHIDL